MRCPNCKIHYMDDERACPMCGTANPHRVRGKLRMEKDLREVRGETIEHRSHRDYPSIRHGKKQETEQAKRKPAKKPQSRPDQAEKPHRSHRTGLIIAAAVVLFAILPTLISMVSGFVTGIQHGPVPELPASSSAEPIDPSYVPPESAYDVLQGGWTRVDDAGYLYLDLDSMVYSYAPDDEAELENGYAMVYELEESQNEDGTLQYVYQIDLYPEYEDTDSYSLCVIGARDDIGILTSMEFGPDDYPDAETMMFWKRLETDGL